MADDNSWWPQFGGFFPGNILQSHPPGSPTLGHVNLGSWSSNPAPPGTTINNTAPASVGADPNAIDAAFGGPPVGPPAPAAAPTTPHVPHYGPWHAGGSPSGPIIANPEDAFTAAFNGGKSTQTANPEDAFTTAYNGGNPPIAIPQININPRAQALAPQGSGPSGSGPSGPASQGSPWDPQGVGYAKSWDPQGVAMAASQRMAAPSVRGALSGPTPNPGDAPQPANSPFTMVMRPNAPANSGGRGGGGTPLGTALDLSGWQPQAAPAPRTYTPDSRDPRYQAQAPRRGGGGYRAQAPQDPGSAFWSTSGPGVGLPAAKGPGFWAVQGPGVGLPANKGPGFWAIHGPGVGMPSPGPVNQPGFWGVHGRGVGFGGNQ